MIIVGDILSVYKIYPEEIEDIDKIKAKLEEGLGEPFKIAEIKEEPIAFGLRLLRVAIIFPDKVDGLLDKVEELLKNIPGVNELEIEASTLI